MLMRDPEENLFGNGRRKRSRIIRTLIGLTLLLVVVSVATAAFGVGSSGDSTASWLSGGSKATNSPDDYIRGAMWGLLAAFLGGLLSGLIRLIRSRAGRSERQPGRRKRVWRYREMSRREKRRLSTVLLITSSLASAPFAVFGLTGDRGGVGETLVLIFTVGGTLGALTGLVMGLVEVRPSRTVMQIVEDRLKSEREQMARQVEQWKNDAIATLYAEIMSQVERGLITCGKCAELGEAHHAAPEEEPRVPAARDAEDAGKPCPCGGPTSVPLLYFPPRFHSKRTAS